MSYADRISGINVIVKKKEQHRYGNKDKGQLIPPEKGRRAIFVPSFGVLETAEIDDIVATAQEQEDERIRKGKMREGEAMTKQTISNLVKLAQQTKEGERAKNIKEVLDEC